jgi:hypothetical protein
MRQGLKEMTLTKPMKRTYNKEQDELKEPEEVRPQKAKTISVPVVQFKCHFDDLNTICPGSQCPSEKKARFPWKLTS